MTTNAKSVALTGDFLAPAWPATTKDGALDMALNAATQSYRVSVSLRHGRLVRCRYLLMVAGSSKPLQASR